MQHGCATTLDAEAFANDGYFRTGDLGITDDEGFVAITGRLKDIIIRHGENISTKEVEDLLFTWLDVADVAVFGGPDDRTGERVVAAIVAPPQPRRQGPQAPTSGRPPTPRRVERGTPYGI